MPRVKGTVTDRLRVLAVHVLRRVASGSRLAASCAKCKLRAAGCSWYRAKISWESWPADNISVQTCVQKSDTQEVRCFAGVVYIYRCFSRTFTQVTPCRETTRITCSDVDYSNLLNILLSPARHPLPPTGVTENSDLELFDYLPLWQKSYSLFLSKNFNISTLHCSKWIQQKNKQGTDNAVSFLV